MDIEEAKSMLKGHMDALNSSFYLSYNMLINALRLEDTKPEYIMKRSLVQFQKRRQLPLIKQKFEDVKKLKEEILVEHEDQLTEILSY